ncbi:MAG: neutral zinc metallopeptidase [Planctomycetes bacterium]|nr:neutral zinc metallopeptidase [Planctomycetota bacterium]
MRWEGGRESDNVEDQRGDGGGGFGGFGGGFGGQPIMLSGTGLVILIIISLVFGLNPLELLQDAQQGAPPPPAVHAPHEAGPEEEHLKKFVSVVLAETEDVWTELFRQQGLQYRKPHLVLFNGRVASACGLSSAATGPFYCPGDERVYLDLSFYRELRQRFQAQGEFAQAYVIAHEVGHHVQKQLGINEQVQEMQRRSDRVRANHLSVCLELQADFFAGVWARHADEMQHILDPGDIESALRCAAAIGDDRLQKQAQGYVVPDSFTHGTSAQRARWFRLGYETGDMTKGDTFNAKEL